MLLSGRAPSWLTRGVAALAVLLTAAVLGLSGSASAIPYETEPSFCQPHTVRDFEAPLKRMPKLHQPSGSGQIGFGPKSLRLRSAPFLLVGGGKVGFTLALARRKGLSLPWTATSALVEVNGNGRPVGRPLRIIRRVGSLKPFKGDSFRFEVGEDPAFYRATVTFRRASGQKLGKFSSYYRVVRPELGARLRLSASTYRPETTVFARVENLGTLPAHYGVGYDIERLVGEAWIEAPENPRGPMIMIGLVSPPGMSGFRCLSFDVPGSMPPGRYRMVNRVNFLSRYTGEGSMQMLSAEFDVAP